MFLTNKIDKYKKTIIFLFFLILLSIGLSSVKDYGTTNDEYTQRLKGLITLNYVGNLFLPNITKKFKADKELPSFEDVPEQLRYYGGSIIHAPLAFFEVLLGIKDKKNVFLFKHYLFFLIYFLSLICFFEIIRKRFKSWKYGFLGVLVLFFTPRIFANSFYNNLDMPFMAFTIISVNFGIRLIENIKFKNIFLFSFFSAIAIDVRLMAILIPSIFSVTLFFNGIKKNNILSSLKIILILFLLTLLMTILFWPFLWDNPLTNLVNVFKNLANHPLDINTFYLGEILNVKNIPWHYVFVWIFITTPIIYILTFFLGLSLFIKNTFQIVPSKINYIDIIFLLILFIPILIVILLGSTLYNGWRHLYFVYPFLVFFIVYGVYFFSDFKNFFKINIFLIILFLGIIDTAFWMTKNHPHQYVFFNRVIAKNAYKNFELDYMAASYKENLEYLIKNEDKKSYKIWNSSETKLFYPLFSLKDSERTKIIESEKNEAEYWITNYYFDRQSYNDEFLNNYELLNEIIVDGNKINSLFKKKLN